MSERRVVFAAGVTYGTPAEKLEQIPSMIRIVESQRENRIDRSHFAKQAAASIDFETVYYVLSADYNRFMDIQLAINLRIHRELENLGVEFAIRRSVSWWSAVARGCEQQLPTAGGIASCAGPRPASAANCNIL